ncbi:MAG: NblA/ycf18 family protein [Cyanobacteria bacterium J06639_18]
MNNSEQLSLEQEFHLRMFADQVRTLSPEQMQDLSIELYRQMIHKDNLYRELLKDYWGVDSNPLSV